MPAPLPPLRGLEDWRRSTHRPVLLVGNGPSAHAVDPRRLPPDPVVVRCNAFLFEPDYVFGDRVDGFFWAVARRWLQVAAAVAGARGDYRFGTFFSPVAVAREGLYALRGEAAWLDQALQPRLSHFEILRAHPGIGPWFGPHGQRRRRGLPTQGLQALATLLCLGFRDIHVTGLDFYQSTRQRYAFAYPAVVREMTAPVHLAPGYEAQFHGIRLDIEFFLALRRHFPDAVIRCLAEDSFFAQLVATSPPAGGRPPGPARDKDHPGFTAALQTALHAPFAGPEGLVGEVAQLGPDRLLVWAWRPEAPALRRPVEIRVGGATVRTLPAARHLPELELGCIGDAAHGLVLSRAALEAEHGPGPIEFVDALTGRRLANGLLAPFATLRADRPSWAEAILLGGAGLSAAEQAAMARRAAADAVFAVPAGGPDPALRASLLATWPEAAALQGEVPPPLEAELAGLCWAMAHWPDRALRLAGFRHLAGAAPALLALGRLAPGLARALLAGFHEGRLGLLVAQPATALSALDLMMQPLVVVTDRIGTLAAAQAAPVSAAHALLQAFPQAQRIEAGLWDLGLEEVLAGLPAGAPALIDGAAVATMPGPVFAALLARLRRGGARILVPFAALAEAQWLGQGAGEFAARLQALEAHGARFLASAAELRRLLALLAAVPEAAILAGDPPPRWPALELRPQPALRCLLVADSLTPELLRRLRRARMRPSFGQRPRVRLEVATEGLFGTAVPGSMDGGSLAWGCGIPDPEALGGYDLVILATQDVGLGLAARFVAAAPGPVPVLAVRGCGLAALLPSEAVLPDLEAALAAAAALAGGESRTVARAPGGRDRAGLAGLIGLLWPGQARGQAGDQAAALLAEAALPAAGPGAPDPRCGTALRLAVVAAEAGPGARLSLMLGNGGPGWLPRGGAAGEGTRVELRLRPLAGPAAPVTLTRRLPHDVAPADAVVLQFAPPGGLPPGGVHVAASVLLGTGRCIAARDFGSIGHGTAA